MKIAQNEARTLTQIRFQPDSNPQGNSWRLSLQIDMYRSVRGKLRATVDLTDGTGCSEASIPFVCFGLDAHLRLRAGLCRNKPHVKNGVFWDGRP
jgi:hypothetical protein